MRIVHEINGKAQTTGNVQPYCVTIDQPNNQWNGAMCDFLIVSKDPITGEEEPIYIEGDLEHVKDALRQVLSLLEMCEESQREFRASQK